MKKFFKGLLKNFILSILGIVAFMWLFSFLFPRAYNVLEGKVLGIKEDSVITIIQKADTVVKADSVKVLKPSTDFKLAVKLEHEDGCYLVPVEINGIPMKMMLDTGASTIVISAIEYEFLVKQKLIPSRCVQETSCSIANGETTQGYTFKLSSVSIGGEVIKDVDCVVMPNSSAPLLLGMNVLRKFGNVRIDYNRNLLILKE